MLLSYVLAAFSLTGLYIVGRRPMIGWSLLAVTEAAWIIWSIAIEQPALALLFVFYFALYVLNFYRSVRNKNVTHGSVRSSR